MSLIVQKFGGTSVADAEKILAAARKAVRAHQQGHQVVMVVSAMGHQTDMLVDLARQVNEKPPAREMDMLLSTGEQVSVALMAMAIESLGYKAISLTGAQIGIRTDSTHTKARIHSISTERMHRALNEGKIVIAAGFQGIDEHYNITTLGRGGSDTTAVALAAVLEAEACEIYTDVDGVYTTDPRVLPEARKVPQVSYDEMLELASLGAGVMHSRSIEFAKKFSVPIHVRSSFSDIPGTMIISEPETMTQPVCGATLVKNEAQVTVQGVPDTPGVSLSLFSKIAARGVSVDMIVQNPGDDRTDISFTVLRDDLLSTLEAVEEVAVEIGAEAVTHDDNVSKVSVVGLGMAEQTGVARQMFRSLAAQGVNILMITTSEIKISVLVSRDQGPLALRTVHAAFELDKPPDERQPLARTERVEGTHSTHSEHIPERNPADVVAQLQGMEELTIDDIALDDSQARVTIAGVPDAPGVAAHVFDRVAEGGIFVDMIVQSFGREQHANLSFTVPRADLDKAVEVADSLTREYGCGPVSADPQVTKLSVSGIGMRSHTGVAIGMFRALAAEGINVEMINTSEVRVNVVVEGASGKKAMQALETEFGNGG